jgi:phosphate transport system substrate-binding protein
MEHPGVVAVPLFAVDHLSPLTMNVLLLMNRLIVRSSAALLVLLAVAGCKGEGGKQEPSGQESNQKVITSKGSDTMVQLAQRWAERYMTLHPDVQVQVTGGGSGTGLSALINGTTDLCNSSRPMKDAEKQQLQEKYGSTGVEVRVARDGITVFLNQANSVKELTMEQLKNIYTGSITNWKSVGGPDEQIIVYGRENSSGTYEFFKEHVLSKADFTSSMQALPGTAAVVSAVKRDVNGIGFGGAGYATEVKECAVKPSAGEPGVLPVEANIDNGTYPISRYLYLYLRERPTGEIKAYIDFILSAEGQEIITKEGFFPVRKSS